MLFNKSGFILLAVVIILGSLMTGCASTSTTTPGATQTAKTWYQQIANSLKDIQPHNAPDTLWPIDGKRLSTDFDVNQYFSVLTHLSMQDGYVLDYIYLSDGTSGGPILYIRGADDSQFNNYTEYKDATHSVPRQANDKSLIWLVKGATNSNFGNKISIDGTAEGYFEYALLQTIGNKFYLLGYTQMSDTYVICEKSAIENIITMLQTAANATLDNDFVKSARKLSVDPKIQINENTVTVELVTFSILTGFDRITLTIQKDYPNLITSQEVDVLLEPKSGQ